MTDLSLDRFRVLADAYGGVVQRWPEAEHDAALRLAHSDPAARVILAEALAFDETLDRWRVPSADPALVARVIAMAPRARRSRLKLWWSGIGIATTLAGAAAGSVAAAVVAPADHGVEATTAFGDPGGQES